MKTAAKTAACRCVAPGPRLSGGKSRRETSVALKNRKDTREIKDMSKQEFLDHLCSGKMSRRRLNRLLAGAGIGLVTLPMFERPARADEQVIYFTWSGYDVPEAHPNYDAKYGAPPDMPLFSDEEEAFQKLRAGFQVDIAHPCSGRINRWRAANLLEPIDNSKLSNWLDEFEWSKKDNDTRTAGQ